MNLLEKICEELGVEIGEEWTGNDGKKYKIWSNEGLLVWLDVANSWAKARTEEYRRLMTDRLKPVWKPKEGDMYYIPAIYDIGDMYQEIVWLDDTHDIEYYSRGLVFKTKEEAIEAANKMLESLKEE